MRAKTSIRKKIFAVAVFLALSIIFATSAAYYYLLTKDIQELSNKQIKHAFDIIFDDLISRTESSVSRIEQFISSSLAGNMRIIYAVRDRPDLEGETELERWRQIQELMSRYNRITTAIGGFTPLLGINGLAVYGIDKRLVAVYQDTAKQKVVGACPGFIQNGTFISSLTKEERLQALKGIADLPQKPIPHEIIQTFQEEIPDSTVATLSTYAGLFTIKIVSPIKQYDRVLGVCVIHIGIPQSDVEHYSRFSRTEINLFAGRALSVGTLTKYDNISYEKSDNLPAIDLYKPVSHLPIVFTDLIVGNIDKYYQGRVYITEKDKVIGAITANFNRKIEKEKRKKLLLYIISIGVLFSFLALFVSSLLSSKFVHPIKELQNAIGKFEEKDFTASVPVYSNDEIGTLAATFNAMAQQLHESFNKINTEIAERKKAEEELREHRDHLEELVKERTAEALDAKERAEAANRAKSVFLANMSHELRTPLNAILGYSQLMRRDFSLPPEQQEYLDTINRSGEHLLALINDVLEISKIEAGQTSVERTTFDFRVLLRNLEKMFDSSMDVKGLRFEVIGIDAVPRYVATDENKLRQVLVNLLGNAVKFTEHGGVTMRVAAEDGAADRMRLKVEVADTGVGIAESEMDKVFAYFEQTASGRAKKSGTGLGLALSRDYARMMGGDITVASIEGKGSTFYFNMDIGKGSASDIKEKIPERRVIGLEPGQNIPRVLVAEDTETSRTLLVEVLKAVGLDVQEAVDGQQAVEMFHKWRPHFIWMDVRMPVMDGLEATRRIKQTETGKSTPIAALTAHALEEEKEVILEAGCDDFVRKPFREQEIFEAMAKHLGLKYVHESRLEKAVPVEPEVDISPVRFAALPEDLLGQLYQAVVELDEERILVLIGKIKTIDDHLAAALDTFVRELALSPLMDLLETIVQPEQDDGHDGS